MEPIKHSTNLVNVINLNPAEELEELINNYNSQVPLNGHDYHSKFLYEEKNIRPAWGRGTTR